MNELIEKLKKKELAQSLGLYRKYHPEKARIIESAGYKNLLFFGGSTKQWEEPCGDPQLYGDTYILKPDYEPEPEYIEIEVIVDDTGMLCLDRVVGNNQHENLWWAMTHKDFVCFHDPFGTETTNPGDIPTWIRTLAAQDGDIKVHARFVKVAK